MQCWGSNTQGQAGNASGADPISAPGPIRTFATVPGVAIAAGGYHSCELMSDGTVMCWGYNHDLQINAGTFGSTHTATPAGVAGAVAVTAGAYHSCALLGNGSAACWGYNHDGETGTSPTPSNTIAISARQIDAATGAGVQGTTAQGGYHTCAVLTNGSVSCWGYNGHGELGNGTTSGPQPVGTAVTAAGLTGPASSVAAGGYHTCAIVGGAVMCWGADESAQLGRGTSGTDLLAPGVISGAPPPAISVDAGGYHTCAVFSGATDDVRCWGRNTEGQVGRNPNNTTVDPVTIPLRPLGF